MNAGRGAGRVRVTTPGGTSHEISITPDEVDALYVAGLKQKIETATGLPKMFQNLAAGPPEALKKLDDSDLLSELVVAVEPTTSDGGGGVSTDFYLLTRVMSPAVVMVADLRDDIPRLPLQFQMASNATLGELKRDVEAFLRQDRPRQEVHFLLSLAGGGIAFTATDDPREVWRALPRFSGVDPCQQYVAPTCDLELRWGR